MAKSLAGHLVLTIPSIAAFPESTHFGGVHVVIVVELIHLPNGRMERFVHEEQSVMMGVPMEVGTIVALGNVAQELLQKVASAKVGLSVGLKPTAVAVTTPLSFSMLGAPKDD